MLGAVLLAGEAALRCGSGLVTVASTTAHLDLPALHRAELMSADAQQLTPEFIAGCDAMVLGPGLGRDEWGAQVYARAVAGGVPTVLDADALFWLAQAPARNQRLDTHAAPRRSGAIVAVATAPKSKPTARPPRKKSPTNSAASAS